MSQENGPASPATGKTGPQKIAAAKPLASGVQSRGPAGQSAPVIPTAIPWARQLIAAARTEVPTYGSPAWHALPDISRTKIAAVVIAAECWRTAGELLAENLAVELDAAHAADDAPGRWTPQQVAAVHHTARRPSHATLSDRRGEPERQARALAHERRMGEVIAS